ncbi:MAG: PAS domain S-box protein [Haloplanus sp.]
MDEASGFRVVLVATAGRLEDPLASTGFDVTAVDSAGDCLRVVEHGDADGIVSGATPPDIDGVRLLRATRVSHPTIPFVLVSDGATASDVIDTASDVIAADVNSAVVDDGDAAAVASRLRDGLRREEVDAGSEGQRRYSSLVERSPAPINLFDDTGESIWCNDAVLDLLGLDDRAELLGRSIFEFIHPDDRDIAKEELTTVIERKESVGPTQMKLLRPDGEVRYVQVATAIGRFLGADIGQAVIVDVTQLQETKNALRDEREFIEQSLDALQDLFYVADAEGNLLRWNAAMTEVTGYDEDELASMNVTALLRDEDAPRMLDSIATVLDEGADTVEVALATEHGRTLPYEFRGRRLSDGADDPRVVGIGRDIFERRERKRQLQVFEQWLRHNIRNETNVIRGIAENIRDGRVDDVEVSARRIVEHTTHVVDQADRERRIVELLTSPPESAALDVTALVRRQVQSGRERHPSADIEIIRADDVVVSAIPDLRAAIRELLENAVGYNDTETPTVEVAVIAGDGGRGIVRVMDDGPGIPEIEWGTMIHDREIDQLHHSSGLGLLFVYWVTRISGGDLSISENDPRGSTVTLTLPAAAE